MQRSVSSAKLGVNPTAEMLHRTLIVGESATLCGNCCTEAPKNANVCRNKNCGMLWLFVAADVALNDEPMSDPWYRLCGEHPGLVFIGTVGFDKEGGFYLAEVSFGPWRPSLRQVLRRLWLDLRRRDETR